MGEIIQLTLTALVRKVLFLTLIFGAFKFADNYYFKAFDTDEAIKNDPQAIAILLGAVIIGLAFA